MPGQALSDIELLDLEVATIWVTDGRGRITGDLSGTAGPLVVLAAAAGAHSLHAGAALSDDVVLALHQSLERTAPAADPSLRPAALTHFARLLKADVGAVQASGGPSYVANGSESFDSAVEVLTSNARTPSAPPRPPERSGWSDDEWRELMNGRQGPWAIALEDDAVVSVCHCSRLNDRAVEAGVWTHPEHRGRGHAAAVTATWARLEAPSGRAIFYSTSSDNLSSRRVAAKLGLREIGWLWSLRPMK